MEQESLVYDCFKCTWKLGILLGTLNLWDGCSWSDFKRFFVGEIWLIEVWRCEEILMEWLGKKNSVERPENLDFEGKFSLETVN